MHLEIRLNPALKFYATVVVFAAGGSTANAAVIDANGHPLTPPTHAGAVFDTSTKLLWLDATETVNRSLADIESNLGPGQEFDGWQIASKSQINVLFANAGLVDTYLNFVANAAAQADVIAFVAIVGQTATMQQFPHLQATNLWHAESLVGSNSAMSAAWISTDDRYWVGLDPIGEAGFASPIYGTALVRPAIVPGDYNGNGHVDPADYVVWRNTNGQAGAGLPADGNGDGFVNSADYDFWRARFGQSASGSAASLGSVQGSYVPEPQITVLVASALIALITCRSRGNFTR